MKIGTIGSGFIVRTILSKVAVTEGKLFFRCVKRRLPLTEPPEDPAHAPRTLPKHKMTLNQSRYIF